jgi:integrase
MMLARSSAALRQDALPVLVSRHRRDDELVLGGLTLKPGTDLAALSRFGDDRWTLSPAIPRENAHRGEQVLDFTIIAAPAQRLTAKEYLWARLHGRAKSAHRKPLSPTTARASLRYLLRFMRFVEEYTGSFTMAAVNQPLLDAYLAFLRKAVHQSNNEIARIIEVALDLNARASHLTLGSFGCRPWNGRPANHVAGCSTASATQENRTPRIPEPVIAALLKWAFKYVNVFANDIFAARDELDRLEQGIDPTITPDTLGLRQALLAYIGRRCVEGRGIPITTDPVGWERVIDPATGEPEPALNFPLIALQLRCSKQTVLDGTNYVRPTLLLAIKRLGPEIGGLDTPISPDPETEQPWRPRFDRRSIQKEEKMLQAACFIICAYLTGMRDSEVQAMEAGCYVVGRSADGIIERHTIKSRYYKNFGRRPIRAEWVTLASVGRAVATIEKLTKQQRRDRNSTGLWQVLGTKSVNARYLSTSTTQIVNEFGEHLDSMFGTPESPVIPHIDGNAWHFTVRQFRRTIAWYIANRPFGTVAGKIQYKHASIAMFEGYAGQSTSGFRREVDQERALGQLDDIVEHYEDFRRGLKPTGPASARILGEFERVQAELDDFPGRIADLKRLKAMLAHLARSLHVGFLNDCFFEPATALCLDRNGTKDRSVPILSHCSPDRCPNSCITRRHLPPWEASIGEADTLLKDKRLPPLQRAALVADNARKRLLIAPLKVDS